MGEFLLDPSAPGASNAAEASAGPFTSGITAAANPIADIPRNVRRDVVLVIYSSSNQVSFV
jgi:hypothetical protein